MRGLAFLLVGFLILAFESPLLYRANMAPYAPDLALIMVLYVSLTSRYISGLVLVLCFGLLKDAFSLSAPVGIYMETMVLAFLVCHRMSRRLALRGPVGVVVITAVFSLGASLVEMGLSVIFDETFEAGERGVGLVLASMLPQALITAPFGPLIFWIMERVERLTARQSETVYQ